MSDSLICYGDADICTAFLGMLQLSVLFVSVSAKFSKAVVTEKVTQSFSVYFHVLCL